MKKYKHLVVIGRIYDGENDYISYQNLTVTDAAARFKKTTLEEWPDNEPEVLIEGVLASDTEIEIYNEHNL